MPRDERKPYRASNGEVFTSVPAGIERVWWTCGAEARLLFGQTASGERDGSTFASANLIDAHEAGWDAMDARLRGKA